MNEKIFAKIREVMKERKVTPEELAEKSGLTLKCIKGIISGTRKRFTLDELDKVATALEVNIKELL